MPSPHIVVVDYVLQRPLERLDARRVRRAGRLTEDGALAMLPEPRGREVEALAADGGAYAGDVCSGAVLVWGVLVGDREEWQLGCLTEVLVEFLLLVRKGLLLSRGVWGDLHRRAWSRLGPRDR